MHPVKKNKHRQKTVRVKRVIHLSLLLVTFIILALN